MTGYEEWSRAGWAAHLPGVADIPAHVAALGEATIPGLAAAAADGLPPAPLTVHPGRGPAGPGRPEIGPGPDDTALLAYPSGTTGRPKAVPLTHRALLTSIRVAMASWGWREDDVLAHALPLFHQHGLGGVHAVLVAGGTARIGSRFTAAGLAAALRGHQAAVLFAVPT